MAVTSKSSFFLSAIVTVILFSGMQMYKSWLISSRLHIVFGGFMGSLLFLFLLTATGNFEAMLFGKSFQMKLFPEICICLVIALAASGMVHRVAITTCFLFSVITLYYIHRISQETYNAALPVNTHTKKKK